MGYILESLKKKYEGEIAVAKANVQVYVDNPAGIGEHSNIVQAVDEQISIIAEAEDRLQVLEKWDSEKERFIDQIMTFDEFTNFMMDETPSLEVFME